MSFHIKIDSKQKVAAKLIGKVHSELNRAIQIVKQDSNVSQQALADKLEINKATLSRRLGGRTNLTLKSLANLIWAIDGDFEFKINMPSDYSVSNSSRHPVSLWRSDTTVNTPSTGASESEPIRNLTTDHIATAEII